MKAFRIFHSAKVPYWERDLVVKFAHWYFENHGVDHQVRVQMYAAGYLDIFDRPDDLAYGCFYVKDGRPCIDLAASWRYWKKGSGIKTRKQAFNKFLNTIAHEFCHYHRYRRGIKNDHRGLQLQVNAWVERFKKIHGIS